MASYTIEDLPRDLTAEESAHLASVVSDIIRRWEWERERPSHVCKRVHAGKTIVTADLDEDGAPITRGGVAQLTRTHTHEPTCHDCGRGLVRPPGASATTWLCPHALRVLPAGSADSAVECGEKPT